MQVICSVWWKGSKISDLFDFLFHIQFRDEDKSGTVDAWGWGSSGCEKPFYSWESQTLRSADKCYWASFFLLPSWRWLGDSHATTQYLHKLLCLIQLSPQGCAKWAWSWLMGIMSGRDEEEKEKEEEEEGLSGFKMEFWTLSDVCTSFLLFSAPTLQVFQMTWLICCWMEYVAFQHRRK